MSVEQAADFIQRFGNVGRTPEELLKERPTEEQLRQARETCVWHVDACFSVIRQHFGMEVRLDT
jgi:hypothetical protein